MALQISLQTYGYHYKDRDGWTGGVDGRDEIALVLDYRIHGMNVVTITIALTMTYC